MEHKICASAECVLCFFFSSRRRHTRCSRDWSSDVCSSDLKRSCTEPAAFEARATRPAFPHGYHGARVRLRRLWREENASLQLLGSLQTEDIFCRSPNPIQPWLAPDQLV